MVYNVHEPLFREITVGIMTTSEHFEILLNNSILDVHVGFIIQGNIML